MEDEIFWENNDHINFLTQFVGAINFKVENLFSILMYDWHEPDTKPQKCYFLVKKLEELTNGNLFEKLCKIINDQEKKEYHHVCLKIIYYYIDEKMKCAASCSDFSTLIEQVLTIIKNNDEFLIQILKFSIVFLQHSELNDELKLKILKIFGNEEINETINEVVTTTCKKSYREMTKNCDEIFFKLVFIMKKKFSMRFKIGYKKFIEIYKNYFGEYWNYEITQNAKLLLLLADIQELTDSKEFILINTKSDLKSDFLSIFQKIAEFRAVFNEPLDDGDQKLLVRK